MTDWTSSDGTVRILIGDCIERLRELPAESVHCCVTSPPYWGLRDYGTASWEGGDEGCDHAVVVGPVTEKYGVCRCGATRIDKQIGLEESPEVFVAKLVDVFREVRRVLRKDGCCWVNLGDSYAHNGACGGGSPDGPRKPRETDAAKQRDMKYRVPAGLKPKDLVGIPWRVAFALQADGWYLRSEIIWHKPNPMPESVTDRPTKSHEQVFLLTKSARYYYDAEAVKEEGVLEPHIRNRASNFKKAGSGSFAGHHQGAETIVLNGTRNRRSVWKIDEEELEQFRQWKAAREQQRPDVWTIATAPYSEAHFATFPPKLIEPCILAGSSAKGCCPACGAPWERVVERGELIPLRGNSTAGPKAMNGDGFGRLASGLAKSGHVPGVREQQTVGWQPTCNCPPAEPVPCVILDPFLGSGTTAQVARLNGRHAIGCELNPDYAELAKRRSMQTLEGSDDTRPLFAAMRQLEF